MRIVALQQYSLWDLIFDPSAVAHGTVRKTFSGRHFNVDSHLSGAQATGIERRRLGDELRGEEFSRRNAMSAVELNEYRPSDDEPFMNERQQKYFKNKLLTWRNEILEQSKDTLDGLQSDNLQLPDIADRASSETDKALELRTRDRQRKLISKIDAALRRLDTGEYGYCEETGEPISLKRLEARPTANLSLEAQERHERSEKIHRDD